MLTSNINALLQDKKRANNPYVLKNKLTSIKANPNAFKPKVMYRNSLLFKIAFYIMYIFVYFVLLLNFKSKSGRLTLIYSLTFDQIYRDNSCQSVSEFFSAGRFGLKKNSEFLIECKSLKRLRGFNNVKVTRDIPLQIYANYCSFSEKSHILIMIVRRFFHSIMMLITIPDFSLVLKEYIFDESIFLGKQEKFIDTVITTQTHLLFQPLIFNLDIVKNKRIMLWYSANSIPIPYKDKTQLVLGLSNDFYHNAKVDEHWVWNKSNADYIRKMNSQKVLIKGSMLFYGASQRQKPLPKFDVLLFDTTPPKFLPENNVFNENHVCDFVSEIVQVIKEFKGYPSIEIGLKPKREVADLHSQKYVDMLHKFYDSGLITRIGHRENIYDLVRNAKVVIAYPFTSPVFIAKELGVDCAFYSSSNLLQSRSVYYGVRFIDNKADLKRFLVQSLKGKL
jgi:polysaccharide biosynthesis PFTS motif protein